MQTGSNSPAGSVLGAALGLAVCAFAGAAPVHAQVVDCADPLGPMAQTVCEDPELRALDEEMGDAFREVVRSTPREDRPVLLRSQRDWLEIRNRCLADADIRQCVSLATRRRIAELGGDAGSAFAAGRPVPPRGEVRQEELEPLPPTQSQSEPQVRSGPEMSGPAGPDVAGPMPPRVAEPAPPAQLDDPAPAVGEPPAPAQPPMADRPVPESPPPPTEGSVDARQFSEYLSASVWRAEIASGVRPGTIYLFHASGSLVIADCVEAYGIGSWRMEGSEIRIADGNSREWTAEIVEADANFVRLRLTERGTGKERTLILRPARGPFACTGSG